MSSAFRISRMLRYGLTALAALAMLGSPSAAWAGCAGTASASCCCCDAPRGDQPMLIEDACGMPCMTAAPEQAPAEAVAGPTLRLSALPAAAFDEYPLLPGAAVSRRTPATPPPDERTLEFRVLRL